MKMLKLSLTSVGVLVATLLVASIALANQSATWVSATVIKVSNITYAQAGTTSSFYPAAPPPVVNNCSTGSTVINRIDNTNYQITSYVSSNGNPCQITETTLQFTNSQPLPPGAALKGSFLNSTTIVLADGRRFISPDPSGQGYYQDGNSTDPANCGSKISGISSARTNATLFGFQARPPSHLNGAAPPCTSSQADSAEYSGLSSVTLDNTLAHQDYRWLTATSIYHSNDQLTYTHQANGTFITASACGIILTVPGTIDTSKLTQAWEQTQILIPTGPHASATAIPQCKSGVTTHISIAPVDPNDPVTLAANGGAGASNPVTCDGGSLTWIICPLITGASDAVDAAKGVLQSLLHVSPLSTSDPTYAIWKNIRNFADIAFVLIFLVMIFGTTLGLDNYTIKKTLPRLVTAAILVQLSFFLAGFVIDIGNILGGGMEALATGIGIGPPSFDFSHSLAAGTLLTAIGVGALGVGLIMLSFTAVIGAVIAILVVILTLIARQVLITLLVILAPLAMVAWVLPNTEKVFRLWYKTLFQVTMLYPIIMLLFIAGRLFATAFHTNPVIAVIGYIVPLFMVPAAFKASGTLFNMASKGVGRVGSMANKQVGLGSNFDKKRAETRQYNSAKRAGDSKTAFGRAVNSKRAGFGFRPSHLQAATMDGIVKKGNVARLDQADRKLEGMTPDQLKEKALDSKSSPLTQRAAISRLASMGAAGTNHLEQILDKNYGGEATHPEWQKAISSNIGDLAKTDPHLVMGSENARKAYEGMGAEQVAALSSTGFKKWSTNATVDRRRDIAAQVLDSKPILNKTTGPRRAEFEIQNNFNAAPSGAPFNPAPTPGSANRTTPLPSPSPSTGPNTNYPPPSPGGSPNTGYPPPIPSSSTPTYTVAMNTNGQPTPSSIPSVPGQPYPNATTTNPANFTTPINPTANNPYQGRVVIPRTSSQLLDPRVEGDDSSQGDDRSVS
jgi:hypothetical protein